MSKCQKCSKAATLHITEVVSDEQYEELHLCEECAHKYLYEDNCNTSADTWATSHTRDTACWKYGKWKHLCFCSTPSRNNNNQH